VKHSSGAARLPTAAVRHWRSRVGDCNENYDEILLITADGAANAPDVSLSKSANGNGTSGKDRNNL
jgi:hypothetical protein